MPNVVPQVKAGGDIYPSRFVVLSGDFTITQAGDNAVLFGIAQEGTRRAPLADYAAETRAAAAGDEVRVYTEGDVCLLEVGAAVTAGNRLKSDLNGKGVPVATTGTVVQNYGAIALQSGAAGEKILVQVRFGDWRPALV